MVLRFRVCCQPRAKGLHIVFQDGWRAKLKARDGNEIDTMFIDKRASKDEKGQILVGKEPSTIAVGEGCETLKGKCLLNVNLEIRGCVGWIPAGGPKIFLYCSRLEFPHCV